VADGVREYSWRVPKDIRLTGKSETFTITVKYDTLELYGKVEASRTVTISKD
jgi:hypothetical protein